MKLTTDLSTLWEWPCWLIYIGRFTHINGYTHQLQVRCRPAKVRRSETDVLPLSHPTNYTVAQLTNTVKLSLPVPAGWPYWFLRCLRPVAFQTVSSATPREVKAAAAGGSVMYQYSTDGLCLQNVITIFNRAVEIKLYFPPFNEYSDSIQLFIYLQI